MKPNEDTRVSPHEARRIAVEAICCERTVRRFFEGFPVRSTCRARIEEALARLSARHSDGAADDSPRSRRRDARAAAAAPPVTAPQEQPVGAKPPDGRARP